MCKEHLAIQARRFSAFSATDRLPATACQPLSPNISPKVAKIEIAFAPVVGTRLLDPFRLAVPNLLANLLVQANKFDSSLQTTPAQANSNSNPPMMTLSLYIAVDSRSV